MTANKYYYVVNLHDDGNGHIDALKNISIYDIRNNDLNLLVDKEIPTTECSMSRVADIIENDIGDSSEYLVTEI